MGKRGARHTYTVECIFSHPDFPCRPRLVLQGHSQATVGAGTSPARRALLDLRVRGLYHRYGISPIPKDPKLS